MDPALSIALLAAGIAVIIKGGDLFVTASVAIATRARIPQVVVGGTLVSLATTAPELAVSATASFQGNPGLAVGNAVGSVICNIGIIIGLLCVLHPLAVRREDFVFPSRVMLGAGVVLTILTASLTLSRGRGLFLVVCAGAYLLVDYVRHRRLGVEPAARDAAPNAVPLPGPGKAAGMFGLGAAMVVAGSRLMSDNAVKLATLMGVPPMVIGLTLVAVGTSLPELVTAVTAARKGVPELSLGNVVGANIMNLTLITGVSAVIRPLTMTRRTQIYNFPAMLVISVLLLTLAKTGGKLTRREGWVFLLFYLLYVGGLFAMQM